jgi:hypothetical protein
MPGEAVGEDASQIVEERMGHGLEADDPGGVLLGCGGGKRPEPLVFPKDVFATFGAVGDSQAALARDPDEPAVTEKRAEDHLELDRVGRDPMKRGAGMFDHTDDFGRALRPRDGRGGSPGPSVP